MSAIASGSPVLARAAVSRNTLMVPKDQPKSRVSVLTESVFRPAKQLENHTTAAKVG